MLNERIEEFDKEKEELKLTISKDFKDNEKKLKEKFQNILDQKNSEIARINREISVSQAQLKQSNHQIKVLLDQNNQMQMGVAPGSQVGSDGQ